MKTKSKKAGAAKAKPQPKQKRRPRTSTISQTENKPTRRVHKVADNDDTALVVVPPPAGQIKDADVSPFTGDWLPPTEIDATDLDKSIDTAKKYGELAERSQMLAAGFGGLGAIYCFYRGQFFTRAKDLLAPTHKWMEWYTQYFSKDEVSRDMRLYESLKHDGPALLKGMTAHAAYARYIRPKNPVNPLAQQNAAERQEAKRNEVVEEYRKENEGVLLTSDCPDKTIRNILTFVNKTDLRNPAFADDLKAVQESIAKQQEEGWHPTRVAKRDPDRVHAMMGMLCDQRTIDSIQAIAEYFNELSKAHGQIEVKRKLVTSTKAVIEGAQAFLALLTGKATK